MTATAMAVSAPKIRGCAAATTIRLLCNPSDNPLERLQAAVLAADPALGDVLHDQNRIRPFAMERQQRGWDVIAFDDAVTRAVLTGAHAWARVVTRTRDVDLLGDGGSILRMRLLTPTSFRIGARRQYTSGPDPRLIFGADDALQRDLRDSGRNPRATLWFHWLVWRGVVLHPLSTEDLMQIPVTIRGDRMERWTGTHRGMVGDVTFDLSALDKGARATVWALARFAELRGVGIHTTYGMGRVRVSEQR